MLDVEAGPSCYALLHGTTPSVGVCVFPLGVGVCSPPQSKVRQQGFADRGGWGKRRSGDECRDGLF
jgi:hypothetical protein